MKVARCFECRAVRRTVDDLGFNQRFPCSRCKRLMVEDEEIPQDIELGIDTRRGA